MNIVIAGGGKIGTTAIENLLAEGHDITVIEKDEKALENITNIFDVMGDCGNGADCETLEEAGIDSAELFIATMGSDELNMLSCFLARKMGAHHTIARIRAPEYNDQSLGFMKHHLNLSMAINPDFLAAQELFNILKLPSAIKIETFSRGHFEMIQFPLKADSKLDGLALRELRENHKAKVLICAVMRGDEVYVPDGNFVLKSGDIIGVMARPQEIEKFLKDLGTLKKQAKDVIILGGSRTAFYLAKMLTKIGNTPKIIELDPKRCHELCEELPKAVIINGDGAEQELLKEEGIENADAFVSLTGMDEENILISIFASKQNVPKVITKINRREMAMMAEGLGLDCIVSPQDTVKNILLRYARALENSLGSNVETLYKIMDGKAEALEFKVSRESAAVGVPLKDLNFKKNIIIAGIIRGRKTLIPGGDDAILEGDKVVIFAANQRLHDLDDILM